MKECYKLKKMFSNVLYKSHIDTVAIVTKWRRLCIKTAKYLDKNRRTEKILVHATLEAHFQLHFWCVTVYVLLGDIHHVHVPCTRRCDSPHAWTKSAVRLTWHSHYLEPGKTNSFIKKTSFQSGIVKTQAPPLLYSTHSLHINRKPSSQVRMFCRTRL